MVYAKETIKHAFLIMAHKNDLTLKTLIKMIDDTRNDIYIHMDIKNDSYNNVEIENLALKSNIFHVKRTNVNWGGYSQINAELLLLSSATRSKRYQYYHLISGADLLIQTQDVFHDFFKKNAGKEFVRFEYPDFRYRERIELYYFFQERIGRGQAGFMIRVANFLCLKVQRLLHIRNKYSKKISFQKGTNWFSITDNLARFILSKRFWIEKTFKYSQCGDEIFLQTIVANSSYKEKLYHMSFDNEPDAIMRLIDWRRGQPYIFTKADRNELCSSPMMFARKFNPDVDEDIIKILGDIYIV